MFEVINHSPRVRELRGADFCECDLYDIFTPTAHTYCLVTGDLCARVFLVKDQNSACLTRSLELIPAVSAWDIAGSELHALVVSVQSATTTPYTAANDQTDAGDVGTRTIWYSPANVDKYYVFDTPEVLDAGIRKLAKIVSRRGLSQPHDTQLPPTPWP